MFGKRDVEKLAAKGNVRALVHALRDHDPQVRRSAASHLGEARAGAAVDPLIAALDDPDDSVADEAVRALARIGDVRAAEPIVARLGMLTNVARSDDLEAAAAAIARAADAVRALADLKAGDTFPQILLMTEGLESEALDSALTALAEAVSKDASDEALLAAAEFAGLFDSQRAAKWMVLAERGDRRAAGPLLAVVEYYGAAEALAQLQDPATVEPLVDLLASGVPDVRKAALKALTEGFAWRPTTPAEAAWEFVTRSEDWTIQVVPRDEAVALAHWGAAVVAGELHRALADEDRVTSRQAILEVLGHLRQPDSLSVLRRYAELGDWGDAMAATRALIEFGGPEALEILEVITTAEREVLKWEAVLSDDYVGASREVVSNDDQRRLAADGLARLRRAKS